MRDRKGSRGPLIVVEGTDGSGKATQAEMLVRRLCADGHRAVLMTFPQYGHYASAFVERYLRGEYGSASEVGPYQASLFYALDRYAAQFNMKKQLSSGTTIVCDRYASSNMGHQGAKITDSKKRDAFLDWLHKLEYEVLNITVPDLTILLRVPPRIGQGFTKSANPSGDIHADNLGHLSAASEAYSYAAKKVRLDRHRMLRR